MEESTKHEATQLIKNEWEAIKEKGVHNFIIRDELLLLLTQPLHDEGNLEQHLSEVEQMTRDVIGKEADKLKLNHFTQTLRGKIRLIMSDNTGLRDRIEKGEGHKRLAPEFK